MEPKWFAKSKTIWGVILGALPILLPAIGLGFGEEDHQLIGGFADAIIEVIAVALVVYGRFVATEPLKIK